MDYTVVQLGQLGAVPTVGCSYKVACNALKAVDTCATALWALVQTGCGIFITTIHATVAVVVY